MKEISTRTTHIIAAEINSIKEQTRKAFLYNSIEIGRRLAEVKQMVPHGEWGSWLEQNVDYSQSTANNLLKIFENYAKDQLSLFGDNVKSQAFVNLSYSQAIALLGVPAEEREVFVKEHDVENMSTRELQKVIKEKQDLERQLRESEEKAEQDRLAHQKIAQSYEDLEKRSKKHDDLVQSLNDDLKKAKEAGDDKAAEMMEADLNKSKDDLANSKKKIEELEEELKKPKIIEKVPESIEVELAELRKKVSQPNSESTIKFKYCFESLVSGFKELLGSLDQIKETDPEAHDKYKTAVTGLLGKMSERL